MGAQPPKSITHMDILGATYVGVPATSGSGAAALLTKMIFFIFATQPSPSPAASPWVFHGSVDFATISIIMPVRIEYVF